MPLIARPTVEAVGALKYYRRPVFLEELGETPSFLWPHGEYQEWLRFQKKLHGSTISTLDDPMASGFNAIENAQSFNEVRRMRSQELLVLLLEIDTLLEALGFITLKAFSVSKDIFGLNDSGLPLLLLCDFSHELSQTIGNILLTLAQLFFKAFQKILRNFSHQFLALLKELKSLAEFTKDRPASANLIAW